MPYTPDQLAKIARMLGRKSDDTLVDVVVGIARSYREQRCRPPNASIVTLRARERAIAAAASEIAKLLGRIIKIYKQKNRHLQDALRLPARQFGDFNLNEEEMAVHKLDMMLHRGQIEAAADHLNKRAKNPTAAKAGRKPNDAVITALAQLMAVWKAAHGTKRGRETFLWAALEPIGYAPGKTAREAHLQAARAILNPR